MPQSYTSLYYHLVFSTKHREPTIVPELHPRLDESIGGSFVAKAGRFWRSAECRIRFTFSSDSAKIARCRACCAS